MYQICKLIWQHTSDMFAVMALHSDNFIHCHTTKQRWICITLSTKRNWLNYLYWGSMKNPISSGKDGAWECLRFGCCCIPLQPFQVCINWIKEFSTYSAGDLKCSAPNIHVDRRLENWKVILGTALEGDMERKLSMASLCCQTRGKELTKIGGTR